MCVCVCVDFILLYIASWFTWIVEVGYICVLHMWCFHYGCVTLISIRNLGDYIRFSRYDVLHIASCFKSRNSLPPVYPAGSVVRRSITSCPVQRIPNHQSFRSPRDPSPRSNMMCCFHYGCVSLILIWSLGSDCV